MPMASELRVDWIGGAGLATLFALAAALTPWRLLHQLYGDAARRQLACTAIAAMAVGWAVYLFGAPRLGPPTAWVLSAIATALACMAVFDFKWFLIPNVHVLILAGAAILRPLRTSWSDVTLGAVVGGGLLLGVRFLFQRTRRVEGLGLGDVKLMTAIGALVGPRLGLWIVVLASAAGVVWGLIRSKGRLGEGVALPFGALAAAPAFGLMVWAAATPGA